MPAEVCDLDRTYAERARKIAAEWQARQLVEHMYQGEVVRLIAPDYRMADDLAVLFAEAREMSARSTRGTP